MKNILICIVALISIVGCSSSKRELFKETDRFVESLSTTYESYGVFGASDHQKETSDGIYSITPIGRLVNVKIRKAVSDEDYEDLKDDLKKHYKNDSRVNDVYICNAGTIMIDCRN